MAVLKKIRQRLFSTEDGYTDNGDENDVQSSPRVITTGVFGEARYDVRPLTLAQLDECWRLDQRCFVDGEAYSRDTFEYLLTTPESVAYRAVTVQGGAMVGFIIGLVEPDRTGHITTVGVAPEHRRRSIARRMMEKIEEGFVHHNISTVRLEVRSVNIGAQRLYVKMGYGVTQRLLRYYSNGGDGLLMVKSLQ